MNAHCRQNHPVQAAMHPRSGAGEFRGDQSGQGPFGEDVVCSEEAGANLHRRGQQHQQHQGDAGRSVRCRRSACGHSGPAIPSHPAPKKVIAERRRRRPIVAETGVTAAPASPTQSKHQQAEQRETRALMPLHKADVAAQAGVEGKTNARGERPVPQPQRPIPNRGAVRHRSAQRGYGVPSLCANPPPWPRRSMRMSMSG